MAKETTAKIARLAARFLSGELKELTREQQLSVCASCVSQAEAEQESVKAWAIEDDATRKIRAVYRRKSESYGFKEFDEHVIPVLIRRADKRLTKRKRGK